MECYYEIGLLLMLVSFREERKGIQSVRAVERSKVCPIDATTAEMRTTQEK